MRVVIVQAGKAKGALSSGCGYHMLVIVSVSAHLEYAKNSVSVVLLMLMEVLWIALAMAWTPLTAWQQLDNSFSQFGDILDLFGPSL